jgi:hypothetical protein
VDVVDNDRMNHVEFYIDNILVPSASDSASPYEYVWRPSGLVLGSEHTVHAVAYDASGNFSSSDTVTVHYLWRLLGLDDDNEPNVPRNLKRIYYRTSRTKLSFRVETYYGWGDYKSPTEGIDVAIFLDVDQNSATGQTRADGGTRPIGDIGAEYRIVVGNHGDSLGRWTGSLWTGNGLVENLIISNNSNFFEVSVALARIVEPEFIDLIVANVVMNTGGQLVWDWAPDVNLGHVTATVDHSYSGSPPSGQAGENRSNQAASALASPFD